MAVYRMAGLLVEMTPKHEHLRKYAEKYLYDGEVGSQEVLDIEAKMERPAAYVNLTDGQVEYMLNGAKFAYKLLTKKGFMLHSSAVAYEGKAYLFSARSGTGKSTHTSFWRQCFGEDKAVIINDDKPALREIDGVFYASGTPFSGKSDLNTDITVPIRAVCFIHRSEVNEIKRLTPDEALEPIFNQILRPKSPELLNLCFEVLDSFLKKVPVFSLGVTYSPDAAVFAYENINSMLENK